MPKQPVRTATDKPEVLATDRVEFKLVQKTRGRPPKLQAPPIPAFKMSEEEAQLFDYFIRAFMEDYPGMMNTDLLDLPIIAAEYIKYLRLVAKELESGELVTMSRQHPGSMYARFKSQILGATRQQRTKNEKPKEDDSESFWNKWAVS